ncbi:hypothetical protein GQ602_000715 [Ophiocordyceps camponoti-floridani]|uniref:Uncharacterized protein n=1 Tax=Ophiocordyceps camponoti-floridani TaxID=2030778 RepID=A0A8H4QCT2_9HYPO|nr:hypothetical protein GQ602_000715 [Ophiocordyceps camponoti-floridani]
MRGASDTGANMLSLAPSPIFSASRDHRPYVPSPLSSSPIRASSPPNGHNSSPPNIRASSPLSPLDGNSRHQRQVQSSPIRPPPPKFRYAARTARPNPILRSPEANRQARHRGFLQMVRDKADDKAWQRRDIETQFLKNNWLANIGRLSHDAPSLTEEDLADAMALNSDSPQPSEEEEVDMMDESNREQRELEAMAASFEEQDLVPTSDDEYDEIFAELALQDKATDLSDQMDLT